MATRVAARYPIAPPKFLDRTTLTDDVPYVGDDIDGFYGEPAAFDAALEVELTLVDQAAQIIALEKLDDEWFEFDETKEIEAEWADEVPTTTWKRVGGWLGLIKRAA